MKYAQWGVHKYSFLIVHLKFPRLPGYLLLDCESMGILCVFKNSLLVSHKICDLSPNNNLRAKMKWQKGLTQASLSCLVIWHRKSSEFV